MFTSDALQNKPFRGTVIVQKKLGPLQLVFVLFGRELSYTHVIGETPLHGLTETDMAEFLTVGASYVLQIESDTPNAPTPIQLASLESRRTLHHSLELTFRFVGFSSELRELIGE